MADYYPVLKRAISSLPSSSGDARRVVYEKARAALLKQLQSYDPPLSPGEVTEQRLSLEECIRRIEGEVAGAAFGLTGATGATSQPPPQSAGSQASPPPKQDAPPAAAAGSPSKPQETTAAPAAPPPSSPAEPRIEPAPPPPDADARPAAPQTPPRGEPPRQPTPVPAPPANRSAGAAPTAPSVELPKPPPSPGPRAEPVRTPPPPPPPPPSATPASGATPGAGLSRLSQTLREAGHLGGASSQAVRSARDAIEDEEEAGNGNAGADDRIEPSFLDKPLGARPAGDAAARPPEPPPRRAEPPVTIPTDVQPKPDAGRTRQSSGQRPPQGHRPAARGRRSAIVPVAMLLVLVAVVGAAAYAWIERDSLVAMWSDPATPPEETPLLAATETPAAGDGLEPKIVDRLPQEGVPSTPVAPDAVEVQTLAEAPSPEIDFPPPPDAAGADVAAGVPDPAPPAATPPEPTVAEAPAATPPAAEAGSDVLVAQRAILYEEPIPGESGSRVDGRVVWSLVNEPVLPGEPPVPQVRAVVEVPDRGITLTLSIRRNTDEGLPASHVVEAKFDLPPDFAGRGIDTTPGLILKQTEDARGDPLVGAVAKVAENLFWVALSGNDQEAAKNVALLRDRQWIDVPIRYGNRRRAILTFEKGPPGDRVLQQALAAWSDG